MTILDKSETLLDIEKPDEKDEEPLEPTADDVAGTPTAHEFVSDTFVPSEEGRTLPLFFT